MARYGLFVLKVPLSPNQPTYRLQVWHPTAKPPSHTIEARWEKFAVFGQCLTVSWKCYKMGQLLPWNANGSVLMAMSDLEILEVSRAPITRDRAPMLPVFGTPTDADTIWPRATKVRIVNTCGGFVFKGQQRQCMYHKCITVFQW